MDRKAGITYIEPLREFVRPSVEKSTPRHTVHLLVELFDGIAISLEQEGGEIDQVRINLLFGLLNDPGNMRMVNLYDRGAEPMLSAQRDAARKRLLISHKRPPE